MSHNSGSDLTPSGIPTSAAILESPGGGGFWRQLGPGMITAAVVIGPGTITIASKLGASEGTGLIWALVLAGSFMMLFTAMAARIGVLNQESVLTLVARQFGRWLAVVVGLLAFVVCAGYQSSNYLACSTALETVTGVPERVWMGVVGAAGLLFVLGARQLYRVLEKVMLALVGVMLVAFVINLLVARPDPVAFVSGLIPRRWAVENTGLVIAMYATTFSVIAALYQATLARQKGWTPSEVGTGVKESMLGIAVLAGVSMMILWTSATVLQGREVASAMDLAGQLEPLLGKTSVWLFCVGFLAAGFSSTVVNAMIGGGLFADGLGFNANLNGAPARVFTALAMAVGLGAGFYLMREGTALGGIIIAQQSTVLTVPLVAVVLILLANSTRVVGERRNNLWQNAWAGFALLVLLAMSFYRLREMFS